MHILNVNVPVISVVEIYIVFANICRYTCSVTLTKHKIINVKHMFMTQLANNTLLLKLSYVGETAC